MPVLADDDVVVHGDAGHVDDGLGHLDVRLRRRRIAGRVVVQDTPETAYRIENLHEPRLRTATGGGNRGLQLVTARDHPANTRHVTVGRFGGHRLTAFAMCQQQKSLADQVRRCVARVFKPGRKDLHWGRTKPARDR